MTNFAFVPAADMAWERNVLGSEVTRLRTEGAMLTIVHGRAGDVVPSHGYTKGCVTFVVSGRIEILGRELRAGDAGTYGPPGFFSVKFLDDATYIVARASNDEITVPDIGERAAHNLDA